MKTLAQPQRCGIGSGQPNGPTNPQQSSPANPTGQPGNREESEPPAWVLADQLGEPERLPWLRAMNSVVWERLTRIPCRRGGLPYGWGPHAVRAAYVRCFGRPPHWDRGRYVYSVPELLAVADLLEAEAAAWEAGR